MVSNDELDETIRIGFRAFSEAIRTHGVKVDKYFELTGQQFELLNNRLTLLLNERLEPKPEPKVKEDVDFEKEIRHASPGFEGTISQEAHEKAITPKPKKTFENVKGDKLEFEFEEYENREGQKNSYMIYHKDSHQMVKYIGKSLIYNGCPDDNGFLYLKKGLGWVLDKDWVVKKA